MNQGWQSMAKWYNIKKGEDNTGEIYMYGVIEDEKWFDSDITPTEFIKDLKDLGAVDLLNLYVNSPGGNVFAAHAINSILGRFEPKIVAHVDGVAASAMGYLIQAADEIKIGSNGMFMLHNAMTFAFGNSKDLRKISDDMDKINESIINAFLARGKITEEKIIEMMDAETWLTGPEAVEIGLADTLIENKKLEVEDKETSTIINGVNFEEKKNKFKNFPKKKLIEDNTTKPKFSLDEPEEQKINMENYLYRNKQTERKLLLAEVE